MGESVPSAAHENSAGTANGTDTPNGTDSPMHPSALLNHPEAFARGGVQFASESEFTALTASALFTPAEVTERLMGSESDPLVHIPLPGWTWNLERRKQWQGALNVWRKIDNFTGVAPPWAG